LQQLQRQRQQPPLTADATLTSPLIEALLRDQQREKAMISFEGAAFARAQANLPPPSRQAAVSQQEKQREHRHQKPTTAASMLWLYAASPCDVRGDATTTTRERSQHASRSENIEEQSK